MIKDGKFVSTGFPQYEINWGMLDDEGYDSAQYDNEGEGL